MFKIVKSAAKTFNKERKRFINCVECRIYKRAQLTDRLSETVILEVYKVSPHSNIHKIVRFVNGVW